MTTASARTVGTLYIVATPIGNRQDIGLRALSTLQSVDKILAEDTRHSGGLLKDLGIHKPLISLHAHNEMEKTKSILESLLMGTNFALISDAGTPLISDPGYPLVHQAREANIPVTPIPGPCAIITALSAAGVPCDAFTFFGFLPAKKSARQQKLAEIGAFNHTVVVYESTHRILACMNDIMTIFGEDYPMVLAKELTKTHEYFQSDTSININTWLTSNEKHCNGEFVLLLPPKVHIENTNEDAQTLKTLSLLLEELPMAKAVKLATKLTGIQKNRLYKLALSINASES